MAPRWARTSWGQVQRLASCKLLVVGDEVSSRQEGAQQEPVQESDHVAVGADQPQEPAAARGSEPHDVVFLSNELQPLALDNTDRRYLVIFTPQRRSRSSSSKLGQWRDSGGVQVLVRAVSAALSFGRLLSVCRPAPGTPARAT